MTLTDKKHMNLPTLIKNKKAEFRDKFTVETAKLDGTPKRTVASLDDGSMFFINADRVESFLVSSLEEAWEEALANRLEDEAVELDKFIKETFKVTKLRRRNDE